MTASFPDGEPDVNWDMCPVCNGTGVQPFNKEEHDRFLEEEILFDIELTEERMFNLIYNYSIESGKGMLLGYQIEAESIADALSKISLFHNKEQIVKICLSDYDND